MNLVLTKIFSTFPQTSFVLITSQRVDPHCTQNVTSSTISLGTRRRLYIMWLRRFSKICAVNRRRIFSHLILSAVCLLYWLPLVSSTKCVEPVSMQLIVNYTIYSYFIGTSELQMFPRIGPRIESVNDAWTKFSKHIWMQCSRYLNNLVLQVQFLKIDNLFIYY